MQKSSWHSAANVSFSMLFLVTKAWWLWFVHRRSVEKKTERSSVHLSICSQHLDCRKGPLYILFAGTYSQQFATTLAMETVRACMSGLKAGRWPMAAEVRWSWIGLVYFPILKSVRSWKEFQTKPTPSMYGIFTIIWLIFMVNVGKYTIHGWYGKII